MSTFDDDGHLIIADGRLISCIGKKGSGKSVIAMMIAQSYPGDMLIIDVNGTDGPVKPDAEYRGDQTVLPTSWPESLREGSKRLVLRYIPDAGSPTYREDIDAAIGLVLKHGRCLVVIHEMGILAPPNRILPHTRRLLIANRHPQVTGILCMPRAMSSDPLVLGQSDVIYALRLPQPADRVRLADVCGASTSEIDAAMASLKPYEYLRVDTNAPEEDQLIIFPPLPRTVVDEVQKWAKGDPGHVVRGRPSRADPLPSSSLG